MKVLLYITVFVFFSNDNEPPKIWAEFFINWLFFSSIYGEFKKYIAPPI